MKIFVETYGCQMNAADSEEMSRHFFDSGFVPVNRKEDADLILLNTCTVRQHAENRALSFIGRLKMWKKNRPEGKIIVAGCAAERLKKTLPKRFPHIDLVIGAKSIEDFPKTINSFLKSENIPTNEASHNKLSYRFSSHSKARSSSFNWFQESETSFGQGDLRSEGKPMSLGDSDNTAFVTIMRGCNYSCSYCIVPFVRGREVYRPVRMILREVRDKVRSGAKEVLLLGQTVNSYWYKEKMENGNEKLTDFSDLLKMVNRIEGLESIRFMSPHPHYLSGKMIQTLSICEKISPQIHLPVQSGSNKMLQKMKRNYTREEYILKVNKLKNAIPDLDLTTDFIVGFPGETEEDFQESLSLIDEIPLNWAYCFKYSPRAGTESSKFEDTVPQTVKKFRLSRILIKIEKNKNETKHLCFAV